MHKKIKTRELCVIPQAVSKLRQDRKLNELFPGKLLPSRQMEGGVLGEGGSLGPNPVQCEGWADGVPFTNPNRGELPGAGCGVNIWWSKGAPSLRCSSASGLPFR